MFAHVCSECNCVLGAVCVSPAGASEDLSGSYTVVLVMLLTLLASMIAVISNTVWLSLCTRLNSG